MTSCNSRSLNWEWVQVLEWMNCSLLLLNLFQHCSIFTKFTETSTSKTITFLFLSQAPRLSPCVRLLGWPDHSGCARNLFVLLRWTSGIQLQHCFSCAIWSSVGGRWRGLVIELLQQKCNLAVAQYCRRKRRHIRVDTQNRMLSE